MAWRTGFGAALTVALCGCGSSGCGSSDGAVSGVTWKADGVLHTAPSATAMLGTRADWFQIMGHDAQGGTLSFGVGTAVPLVPGSYTCELPITGEASAANINYSIGQVVGWASFCTITVTSIGGIGERVTGMFTAGLNLDDGTTVTPFAVTDGIYDVPLTAPR